MVAPGRNAAVLDDLRRRFGKLLVPVPLKGDAGAVTEAMRRAAAGPIDAVLDFLPPSAGASVARAAIMSLRQGGRAVLMGGVGMLGGEDLALPYPWFMRNLITVRGQWMYEAAAVTCMLGLIRGGLPAAIGGDGIPARVGQRSRRACGRQSRAFQADGAQAVVIDDPRRGRKGSHRPLTVWLAGKATSPSARPATSPPAALPGSSRASWAAPLPQPREASRGPIPAGVNAGPPPARPPRRRGRPRPGPP